jgi:hypothetical protein
VLSKGYHVCSHGSRNLINWHQDWTTATDIDPR